MGELSFHDQKYFKKHNICVDDITEETTAKVVINKLTPFFVELDEVLSVKICETHLKLLTYNHPTLRHSTCPILKGGIKCKSKSEADRSRVTFKVSSHIYQLTKQHVVVGSSLCKKHRLEFATTATNKDPSDISLSPHLDPSFGLGKKTGEDLSGGSGAIDLLTSGSVSGVRHEVKQEESLLLCGKLDNYLEDGTAHPHPNDESQDNLANIETEMCVDLETVDDSLNIKDPPGDMPAPGSKRKAFVLAKESIPKLMKFDSDCSTSSQQPDSQGSTFSSSSDIIMDHSLNNFIKLKSFLEEFDPSLTINIPQPVDTTNAVHRKTFKRYAETVAKVWKLVLETFLLNPDQVPLHSRNNFIKSVIKSLDCENDQYVSLALNVLESIKDYYSMACKSKSRSAIATRKQILQATTGERVRTANQLSSLTESIGARRQTVEKEAENRKKMEEVDEIVPYLEILKRKFPEGSKIVSETEQLEVIAFYEKPHISDNLKGHSNVLREQVANSDGSKSVFLRPKRVMKVHLCELLQLARDEIGFKYSLSTLMGLRPAWVLLPREARCLTCLCDRCANVQSCLVALSKFVQKKRQHGSPVDRAALSGFEITPSISEFLSHVLHLKEECEQWHRAECYEQRCVSTQASPCRSEKLAIFFSQLVKHFGATETKLYQHMRVSYVKADGSTGTKMEQVETLQTISSIVELLDSRMFGKFHQQPCIQHMLKILLASKMRQDIHKNLRVCDLACYTDYSKEMEVVDQEQVKSSAFGASNITIQLIGQVYEMKAVKSSPPKCLSFNENLQKLSFSSPEQDGGSHIQLYEIHIKPEANDNSAWQLLAEVKVGKFSDQPELPADLFGRLGGKFQLKIFPRSLVGLGACGEISVFLTGDLPLREDSEMEILSERFELTHLTFYVEYYFFSDHYDAPKVG